MKILFIASATNWDGANVALYNLIAGLCTRIVLPFIQEDEIPLKG